jgi:hypothetical protein
MSIKISWAYDEMEKGERRKENGEWRMEKGE